MSSESKSDRLTVLAVDDEPLIRELLMCVLDMLGYLYLTAASGEDALEQLRGGAKVDLMISDIRMPGMDGTALAREVRAFKPDLPILFVSAHAPQFHGAEFNMGRGTALVTKPFTLAKLNRAIKQTLALGVSPSENCHG